MKKLDFIQEVVKLAKADRAFNLMRKWNGAAYARRWSDGDINVYLYSSLEIAIGQMNSSHETVGDLLVTEAVFPLYSSIFD